MLPTKSFFFQFKCCLFIAYAKNFDNLSVIIKNGLITPGYPDPFAIAFYVFIFIDGISVRMAYQVGNHGRKITARGIGLRHNCSYNTIPAYFILRIAEKTLGEFVEKSNLAFSI